MNQNRNTGLITALRYKGQGPMLTFVLHRIGGLGMAIFIGVHILASFIGGKTGGVINDIYQHWGFQLFIFFCIFFHAINGMRITILDLFPKLIPHQRQAIWVEWAIFIPLYGYAAYVIISTALAG